MMSALALTVGAGTVGGDEKFGMGSVVGFSDSIPNVLDY